METQQQTHLTEEELQELLLGIDEPMQAEGTGALKQTLASLPLSGQLPQAKRTWPWDRITSLLLGCLLGGMLMLPWSWYTTHRFDRSVRQLTEQVSCLLQQLKQYEEPPHPTKQEVIQPLSPNTAVSRTT